MCIWDSGASSSANAKIKPLEENVKSVNYEKQSQTTAKDLLETNSPQTKTASLDSGDVVADCENSSVDSTRSTETHSAHSLQVDVRQPLTEEKQGFDDSVRKCNSPNCLSVGSNCTISGTKDEIARLKLFEMSLRDQIKNLLQQRDNLVVELQQLQDAKPVLSKAYAVSNIHRRQYIISEFND